MIRLIRWRFRETRGRWRWAPGDNGATLVVELPWRWNAYLKLRPWRWRKVRADLWQEGRSGNE